MIGVSAPQTGVFKSNAQRGSQHALKALQWCLLEEAENQYQKDRK